MTVPTVRCELSFKIILFLDEVDFKPIEILSDAPLGLLIVYLVEVGIDPFQDSISYILGAH